MLGSFVLRVRPPGVSAGGPSPVIGTRGPVTTDVLPIAVAVISTLVVIALCAAVVYLLRAVRDLRREASALAAEAAELIGEMSLAAERAGAEVDRVERMVGSAEAISDAVGSASRLVGGVVADPLIKLVALGSGIAQGARHLSGAPQGPKRGVGRSRRRPTRRLGAPEHAPGDPAVALPAPPGPRRRPWRGK